jgi:threonylcarbamoyladenosine tRNA methylthiotransferase MtaB
MGCRLNQAETALLQSRFIARGYALTESPFDADLFVLHTCTLTAHAAARCRRRLRHVIRRNPAACVAAIGCYAQTDAEELARIAGVDYVVGTADKLRLDEIIAAPAKNARAVVMNGAAGREPFTVPGAGYDPLHTRANLKVQEGCDFACAFCIIPRSRGRARSRDFGDILREARELSQQGHREIILTGVNIGTYRESGRTLSDMIRALEDIDGIDRIRISSIEPTTVELSILERMAARGKLCPYLHVPVQSGDDGVLHAMRRRYDVREYGSFMRDAMERVPGIGFGTDIIVGFPGEDDAAFRRSCNLVAALPFVNVHVFSFSARPRTRAHGMSGHVAPAEVRRRSDFLHRVAQSHREALYRSMVGRDVRVLFEARAHDGTFSGFSDEYVRVRVHSTHNLANQLLTVRLTGVEATLNGERILARGEIVEPVGNGGHA